MGEKARVSHSARPRAWLHNRLPLRAKRTGQGIVGRQAQSRQRVKGDAEIARAAAPIDDRDRADGPGVGRTRNGNGLARRPACRDDVFDNEHALALVEREPPPEREGAVLPFREYRTHAQGPGYLVTDDEATERRRQDNLRIERPRRLRQGLAQPGGVPGILQHERALQISGAVQPRRELEMPLEERAARPEQRQNVIH
jgi:hypothetical protein